MTISNKKVTVIAEIGWNFMGDMGLAKEMIGAASECDADVCKFQYWDPKFLKPGAWDNDGRREIYKSAKLDENKINKLACLCDEFGVEFLVSVFSVKGAELMKNLGFGSIKIPSHEAYNLPLYEFVLNNFNTVYASLGACTHKELEAVANLYHLNSSKLERFNAMHCVSSYPCEEEYLNLPRLDLLSNMFAETGFSDHSGSEISGAIAVGMGGTVIEKHFTIDNTLPGRDNQFALTPEAFKRYVSNIRKAEMMLIDHGAEFQEKERDVVENYRGRWSVGE